MDTSTIVMLAIAFVFLMIVYMKAPQSAGEGLHASIALVLEITPRMIAAFIIAGLIQVIIPEELIARWMGEGSGFKGIFIGIAFGTITPGGPMTHFPIIASFYRMGMAIGPLVSYLTAWALLGVQRVIMWELPFLGPRIVFIRILASILFPFLAGWFSELLWKKLVL